MSAAFTPGPWAWDDDLRRLSGVRGEADDGEVITDGGYDGTWLSYKKSDEHRLANAHLIAAAPELFEACRAMLAERSAVAQLSDACQLGIAALSKALGEPQ